jgi:hypothetical protein
MGMDIDNTRCNPRAVQLNHFGAFGFQIFADTRDFAIFNQHVTRVYLLARAR